MEMDQLSNEIDVVSLRLPSKSAVKRPVFVQSHLQSHCIDELPGVKQNGNPTRTVQINVGRRQVLENRDTKYDRICRKTMLHTTD